MPVCCSPHLSYATPTATSRSGNDRPDCVSLSNRMPALDGSTHDSVSNVDPEPTTPPLERPRPAPELSIVVPTFNERENIPRLVETLKIALPDIAWELIVVDDNS